MAKNIKTNGDALPAVYLNFLNFAVSTGEDEDGSGPLLHNVSAGSTTVYTLALAYNGTNFPNAAYFPGLIVTFRAHAGNTGASTININGIGAKDIRRLDGTALSSGDFATNDFLVLVYDSTADYFRWISSPHEHAGSGDGGNTLDTPTISNLTNAGHDHSNAAGGGAVLDVDEISATTSPGGSPDVNTIYKDNIVKGWAHFNGSTATLNNHFNVSGVVRNGVGDYTVTWDTDFADADYAVVVTSVGGAEVIEHTTLAVGSYRFTTQTVAGVAADSTVITVIAIGDQ